MRTKPMSERIAEVTEQIESYDPSFGDTYHLGKLALEIIKKLQDELAKSSEDWQSLSKDYVQIEEENEALKAKLKEAEEAIILEHRKNHLFDDREVLTDSGGQIYND